MEEKMLAEVAQQHRSLLVEFARLSIWWLSPEEALRYPQQIVAQEMNIGLFRDLNRLAPAVRSLPAVIIRPGILPA